MKTLLCSTLGLFAFTTGISTKAADGPPPPSVNQPSGINLGGTSFYDGFAGPPGLSHLVYLKHNSATSFRNKNGHDNNAFDTPRLNVTTLLNQLSYYSPQTIGANAHLGWSLIIPIVFLDGDFGDAGTRLKDNATGLGDIVTGPQVQFDPVIGDGGRPVFVQRFALDFILPTGRYDEHKDLNQGSNFYSFNPYWAATWMPVPRWEMSWRLHYLYNFRNDDPASSSAQFFEGQPVRNTQAGEAAWSNFTLSYEVVPNVSAGLNGYFFKQLEDDRVNGHRLEDSREKVLGIGPGLFWKISKDQGFWLNLYHETDVENRARNDFSVQVRFAHVL
ncbi:transporter [Pseudomonas sp. NPDC089734]|uniref:SphA family protein n=1 Tax=Pseudomonas sp. NPDC089734 TaxID=3364469 RepID=UPI0038233770